MANAKKHAVAHGRNADLLPTPTLGADEFEDFTERVLSAHRFVPAPLVHVTSVERWGRKGDKQDGIDFAGTWSDGSSAAWQCKRQDALTAAQVRKYVAECSFEADRYYLVYSGEASSTARAETKLHKGWQLLDQRDLTRLTTDLPLHRRRQVLDATWGPAVRRRHLNSAGEDAFLTLDDFRAGRLSETGVLNDRGLFAGRTRELKSFRSALDRSAGFPPVIIVAGAGGKGKSRLISHSLEQFQSEHPQIPVLVLSPGRNLDSEALAELPLTPAVVVIDDVHRDPDQLRVLLEYQVRYPDTQLVLGSRGQGIQPIQSILHSVGLTANQIKIIEVEDLPYKSAKKMVESLAEGTNLPKPFLRHLIVQAQDDPYVAVVVVNLARRGELTPGYLTLDGAFRAQVLAKYEDVLIGAPPGFDVDMVRTFLATVAALGTVDLREPDVQSKLAGFLDLERSALLRLAKEMADRGVLQTRGSTSRVVPEVLADQILESRSVIFGADSGFAADIWRAFGGAGEWQILTNLASLEWRLTSQSLPSILESIWDEIDNLLRTAPLRTVQAYLSASEPLALTQPRRLVRSLTPITDRLDNFEVEAEQDVDPDPWESLWRSTPLSAAEVKMQLPKLFTIAATHEPDLLEQALDVLWEHARVDRRQTNPHTDHPRRLVADKLGDLGNLPDRSFPSRIVARVEVWLEAASDPADATTPLFALESLTAKDGHRTYIVDRRKIQMEPFYISATWARPLRDSIRRILIDQGTSPDLRRAAAAIDILSGMLAGPHSMFGNKVSPAMKSSWLEDDLATVEAMEKIAHETDHAIVRRLVRRGADRQVQYGRGKVATRALALARDLDQLEGDDLSEILLPPHFFGAGSLRGSSSTQRPRKRSGTERLDEHDRERRALAVGVADRLWARGVTEQSLQSVSTGLDEVAFTSDKDRSGLENLYAAVAVERAAWIGDLVLSIDAFGASKLDLDLDELIFAWLATDETNATAYLQNFTELRVEVRRAVAQMFSRRDNPAPALETVKDAGILDRDDLARQRFLASLGQDLVLDPSATVNRAIAAGISPWAAKQIVGEIWRFDRTWGSSLSEQECRDVLRILQLAGLTEWSSQRIIANLATGHLAPVLDAFLEARADPYRHGLDHEVVDQVKLKYAELTAWLISNIRSGKSPFDVGRVVDAVTAERLDSSLGQHIEGEVSALSAEEMVNLIHSLDGEQFWVATAPQLASAMLKRADSFQVTDREQIVEMLRHSTQPTHWSGSGSGSSELANALAANKIAASVADRDDLAQLHRDAIRSLGAMMERDRKRVEIEEDDED